MNYIYRSISYLLISTCLLLPRLQAQDASTSEDSAAEFQQATTVLSHWYESMLLRTMLLEAYFYRTDMRDRDVRGALIKSQEDLLALGSSLGLYLLQAQTATTEKQNLAATLIDRTRLIPPQLARTLAPHAHEDQAIAAYLLQQSLQTLITQLATVAAASIEEMQEDLATSQRLTNDPNMQRMMQLLLDKLAGSSIRLHTENLQRPGRLIQVKLDAMRAVLKLAKPGEKINELITAIRNVKQLFDRERYHALLDPDVDEKNKIFYDQLSRLADTLQSLRNALGDLGVRIDLIPVPRDLNARLGNIARTQIFQDTYSDLLALPSNRFLETITMHPADPFYDEASEVAAAALRSWQNQANLTLALDVKGASLPLLGADLTATALLNQPLTLTSPTLVIARSPHALLLRLAEIFKLFIQCQQFVVTNPTKLANNWWGNIQNRSLAQMILILGKLLLARPSLIPVFFAHLSSDNRSYQPGAVQDFYAIYLHLLGQAESAEVVDNAKSQLVRYGVLPEDLLLPALPNDSSMAISRMLMLMASHLQPSDADAAPAGMIVALRGSARTRALVSLQVDLAVRAAELNAALPLIPSRTLELQTIRSTLQSLAHPLRLLH